MAKTNEQKRADDVYAAISSLYDLFPVVKDRYNNCVDVNTKEIQQLRKKIKKRKDQLAADAELLKLESELKEEKCKIVNAMKTQRAKVDDLLRRLRVRGVTPDLLDDIEKVSKEKPVYTPLCGCDED